MNIKKWEYKQRQAPNKQSLHYRNFMKQYRAYNRFIAKWGRLPMQSNSCNRRPIAERRLYQWASQIKHRMQQRKLPQWKYNLCTNIVGWEWNRQSNVWTQRYLECKAYIEQYGHTPTQIRPERFPERIHKGKWISPVDAQLHTLSIWVMCQRKKFNKGELLPQRLNALIDIDFEFEPPMGRSVRTNGMIDGMDTMENINRIVEENDYV